MTTKKEREYADFVAFSKTYFGYQIDFEQLNPPEPDIIFHDSGKRIGCELTTIFRDNFIESKESNQKKSESHQDSICKSITEWLNNNIPANIKIHIDFNNDNLKKSHETSLKKDILNVIERYISELNLSEFSTFNVDKNEVLPHEVNHISFTYDPKLQKSVVLPGRGGGIPKLDDERIRLNILKKEGKLPNYAHLVNEKWLILIIQNYFQSSEFTILERGYNNVVSLFDKVFLFLRGDRKILHLKG
jgi:hypothetical protein